MASGCTVEASDGYHLSNQVTIFDLISEQSA